jgi:RNA polymerase sigma-70 factor (ECF subfamily)
VCAEAYLRGHEREVGVTVPLYRLWLSDGGANGGSSRRRMLGARSRAGARDAAPVDMASLAMAHEDVLVLERLRADDAAAFESLYVKLAPRLWKVAYRYLQSASDAEDVVQDVFHRFWSNRATLDIRTSISAYLYGAVRFRAIRVRQERRRGDGAAHAMGDVHDVAMNPAAHVEADDFDAAVRRILDRTRSPVRDVLYLRWGHGMSYDNIAAVLGISAASARQAVHRILRRLGPAFRTLLSE